MSGKHNLNQGVVDALFTGKLEHTGTKIGFNSKAAIVAPTLSAGSTDGTISALAIAGTYAQAEVVALRDACETLGDDVRSIRTALIALGLTV